jgi:hypothetical protein
MLSIELAVNIGMLTVFASSDELVSMSVPISAVRGCVLSRDQTSR